MDRKELINRLEFHNDFVFDDQVKPIAAIQFDILVYNWQRLLLFNLQPEPLQFKDQAGLIGRFQ